ncbi:uncharacterized protein LOC105704107 [Orussus abietinus]|uniref:uncharacterized protein LOC105704107 n=1 Tax=Orussus abietinus TaxID=222816 RepID=UPI000C715D26|nr:uncharacterized protein LOC105704107 [Orussus abietinus]
MTSTLQISIDEMAKEFLNNDKALRQKNSDQIKAKQTSRRIRKEKIKLDVYRNLIIDTSVSEICYKEGDEEESKLNTLMHWETNECPYFYNDRNYAILPDIPKRFLSNNAEMEMNSLFFSCFCEKRYDGTRRLTLHGNDLLPRIRRRFEDWDIPHLTIFLRSNQDVVSLRLPYNRIRCAGFINLIDHIKEYNNIVELDVQNNDICGPGINHLCCIGGLRLKILRLNGNKIKAESAKQLALTLLRNPYLRHLDVAEIDQSTSSLVWFTTVMSWNQDVYNETLKILNISRPNPAHMYFIDTSDFAEKIGAMLRYNRSLVELHLQKYGFSCHDIEVMLIDGTRNETLHLLDLSNNNIGDHGADVLSNWLAKKPSLRGLFLGHNIITNYGARSLSFSLPFSKIRILDISYNRITDTGAVDILNSLKKVYQMRHLQIFGNCLGHDTAQIVQRMLVSGVLQQENLDVKPYKVDTKWYFAHYPADRYKHLYYEVPDYGFPQPLKLPYIKNKFKGMAKPKVNFKYVAPVPIQRRRSKLQKGHPFQCVCCVCQEDKAMNSLGSSISSISTFTRELCVCGVCIYDESLKQPSITHSDTSSRRESCTEHANDCSCSCTENEDESLISGINHSESCECCHCAVEEEEKSSSPSTSSIHLLETVCQANPV